MYRFDKTFIAGGGRTFAIWGCRLSKSIDCFL